MALAQVLDRRSDRAVLPGADDPYLIARTGQLRGQGGKMSFWPAFGRAVFGARAQASYRSVEVQTKLVQRGIAVSLHNA